MRIDSALLEAQNFISGVKPNDLAVYALNIFTAEQVFASQPGSGYRDIVTDDSLLTSTNYSEMPCGEIVRRESGLLVFDLPPFWRSMFFVAQLNVESGSSNTYVKAELEYGLGETREIGRSAQTSVDRRHQAVLVGGYGGLAPADELRQNKLHIKTYGTQTYFGCNIIIGVRF